MPYTTTNLPPAITDGGVSLTYAWAAAQTYYGYTNIATVQYEFPKAGNLINLTHSAIGQEITNAALEMHGQIGRMYSMPYLGNDAAVLQMLGDINCKLAVANLIDRSFNQNQPNEESVQSAEWRSWGELMLDDIKTGAILWGVTGLPGADVVRLPEAPIYPLSAAAAVYPDWASTAPIFTILDQRYPRRMLT